MSKIEMRGVDRFHLSPSNNEERNLNFGSLVYDLNAHSIRLRSSSVNEI
jgi:hypothetical protein